MQQQTILILGDYDQSSELHNRTRSALLATASQLGMILNTRWMNAQDLNLYPSMVSEASAVFLAPHAQRDDLPPQHGLLSALRMVRELDLPFMATGDAHQLVFLEAARNVLEEDDATGFPYERHNKNSVTVAIEPEASSAHGPQRSIQVQPIADGPAIAFLGQAARTEQITCQSTLNPDWGPAMTRAGFHPGAYEEESSRPVLWSLQEQRFHWTATYLPQYPTENPTPHPLLKNLLLAIDRQP